MQTTYEGEEPRRQSRVAHVENSPRTQTRQGKKKRPVEPEKEEEVDKLET